MAAGVQQNCQIPSPLLFFMIFIFVTGIFVHNNLIIRGKLLIVESELYGIQCNHCSFSIGKNIEDIVIRHFYLEQDYRKQYEILGLEKEDECNLVHTKSNGKGFAFLFSIKMHGTRII